jgi:hypothetical protein
MKYQPVEYYPTKGSGAAIAAQATVDIARHLEVRGPLRVCVGDAPEGGFWASLYGEEESFGEHPNPDCVGATPAAALEALLAQATDILMQALYETGEWPVRLCG